MALAPVVPGPRLTLRPFRGEDVTDQYLSWLNDPVLMRFSRQRERQHDRETSAGYLRSFDGTPHYFWAVEERSSGGLAGTMTAFREGGATDVGILIGWPGRGLGGEAWGMALDQLLRVERRDRVTGGSAADHLAMRRIFERWGMGLESEDAGGSIVRYGITREAWTGRAPAEFRR